MTPEKVYERFCEEFPGLVPQVTRWFKRHTDSAEASIRLMLRNNRSLIFSINKDGTWVLKRRGGRG